MTESTQDPKHAALQLARGRRWRDDWATETRSLLKLMPLHMPTRSFDREAPTAELLIPGERRPDWFLNLWHYVYRFYDAEQQPLYTGISSCSAVRLDNHRRRSEWWPLAEYIAISVYASQGGAEEAERAALRKERPRFNKQGVNGPMRVLLPVREPEEAAALLYRQALPEFLEAFVALMNEPSRFPQPTAPPPAWGPDDTKQAAT